MRLLARWRRGEGELSCREVGKVLQAYLDGEDDPERRRAVAAHLEACARCGLEADVYRRLKASLAAGEMPVDPEVTRRLRSFAEGLTADADEPESPADSP